MRIGLVSALPEELSALWSQFENGERRHIAGREYRAAHWHGAELVAVLSGIGKVAAASTATVLIDHFRVDEIILTGTAGGLAPGVAVGDVVVARAFIQHDMDASPLFPRHLVPGYGRAEFPTDDASANRLHDAARWVLEHRQTLLEADAMREFALQAPRVHQGLIASGDRFVATAAESGALRAALPAALAVEMEGAAIAQVCADFRIPLAALRTVSDRADDQAHVDFRRFVTRVASHYSRAILDRYLELRAGCN